MQTKDRLLLTSLIAIGGLIAPSHLEAKAKIRQHNIQLQLSDSSGFPVAGTEFWVTIDIIKDGPMVTLQLPLINFQTGQVAANNPYGPTGQVLPGIPSSGGYLYTSDGFLSKKYRPIDLVPRSIVAASDNGLSPVFSFTQNPNTFPQPPAGYIVQVTNAGGITVQAAGTFGNIIAAGPQILMPCSISYMVPSQKKFSRNTKISTGATNVTQFIGGALGNGFRDTHANDAFDGIVAFAWNDNSMFTHLDNGTMDTMVAIGKIKNGKLKMKSPINLTNFPDLPLTPTYRGLQPLNATVTINRTNPDNMIVSWGLCDRSNGLPTVFTPYRAVSFDGGKTWPCQFNGIMNVIPTGNPSGFGDCLGAVSDKFGNIWYCCSNRFDDEGELINQAYFAVSTDGGIHFTLVYTVPVEAPNLTDYPNYCFGINENGDYGLYFQTTYASFETNDAWPSVGFIPVEGLGLFGEPQYTQLPGLAPALVTADITASNDGRVWILGNDSGILAPPYTFIQPILLAFKSPSTTLDLNWAGAWDTSIINNVEDAHADIPEDLPQPISFQDYIFATTKSILYDNQRQALYALVNGQEPYFGQDMQIYFLISRDNGMTWSAPTRLNTQRFANRGFQSMALDSTNGNLIFGWYDGRNDSTYQSVEYYGAVLTAHELDKMVNAIPLSNPTFVVPSAA